MITTAKLTSSARAALAYAHAQPCVAEAGLPDDERQGGEAK